MVEVKEEVVKGVKVKKEEELNEKEEEGEGRRENKGI